MTHMLSGGVENEKERALKKRLIDQFDGSFCLWTVLWVNCVVENTVQFVKGRRDKKISARYIESRIYNPNYCKNTSEIKKASCSLSALSRGYWNSRWHSDESGMILGGNPL